MVRFRTKNKGGTSTLFLQPRRRSDVSSQRDGKRGVAKEEGVMSTRVRSAFDAILDGAVLGLVAVAAGILALWWMFPS